MAHRALVAYRDGDRYTLHYAHWGDGLTGTITSETPFGGPVDCQRRGSEPPTGHVAPDSLAEQLDLAQSDGYAGPTRVDPRPLARDIDPERVLAAIDSTVESLVVVEPDFETGTYAVCQLGINGGEPLVLAGPLDDEVTVRRTLRTVKERLGERVDRGGLDAATARRVVRRTLERTAPVHAPDDASFLRTD